MAYWLGFWPLLWPHSSAPLVRTLRPGKLPSAAKKKKEPKSFESSLPLIIMRQAKSVFLQSPLKMTFYSFLFFILSNTSNVSNINLVKYDI